MANMYSRPQNDFLKDILPRAMKIIRLGLNVFLVNCGISGFKCPNDVYGDLNHVSNQFFNPSPSTPSCLSLCPEKCSSCVAPQTFVLFKLYIGDFGLFLVFPIVEGNICGAGTVLVEDQMLGDQTDQ